MVQWMNLHLNNSFVNWTQLPLLCEKSGPILLVLVGLMAGRQAVRQAVRGNTGRFKFFTDCIGRIFTVIQCYYSVTNAFFV